MNTIFPKQRLSFSKKAADNFRWAKDCIDALAMNYASASNYETNTTETSNWNRMLSNYQLYNNVINQKDFESTFNPLGLQVGQFKDEVQPYNKAYNKIQVLLGDELARPIDYRVVLSSESGVAAKLAHKNKLLRDYVRYKIESQIASYTEQYPDQDPSELVPPEKLDEYMTKTYRDPEESAATKILDYVIRSKHVKEKMNDAFKHALISGYEVVRVFPNNGEVDILPVNPLGLLYHKTPDVKFVEDGLYAGYRTTMDSSSVLDAFPDLSDKDIKKIEARLKNVNSLDGKLGTKDMRYQTEDVLDPFIQMDNSTHPDEGTYGPSNSNDWVVIHMEWRSQKKVGFLTFINEFGEPEQDIVSEDFQVPDYAESVTSTDKVTGKRTTVYMFDDKTLYWDWIPEIWEGYRIGDDIYTGVGPKKHQFRDADNPYSVKLSYHGMAYNNMNAPNVSLMDRMKPFQYLYFIVMHKLKKLIAKDKGKVFHFDISMLPEEMSVQKVLYYLEEMDIDFYNPLKNAEKPGGFNRGKISGVTDRSNMQHIMNYINLLNSLDLQISDVAGVNRQREGQIVPTEAVTNSQQNIMQSATITEAAYFSPHYQVWERVLNSAVNLQEFLWQGMSIKKQYVLDDLELGVLELNTDQIKNSSKQVYISNTQRDNEAFMQVRNYMLALIQNDKASFSDLVSIYKARSIGELERMAKRAEERIQQNQLEQIKAQQESHEKALEASFALEDLKARNTQDLQSMEDAAELERLILQLSAEEQTDQRKAAIEEAKLKLKKYEIDKKAAIERSKASKSSNS